MHKYLRFGFIENLGAVRHIPVGALGGVKISLTPTVWLFPFVFLLLRFALNSFDTNSTFAARLYDSVVFMLGVAAFTLTHAFGHLLSGKLVGSSMDELLFTATRGVNIYDGDQTLVPGRVHLGRALGGPIANLLCAALLFLLLPSTGGFLADVIASTASTNLFAGAGSFLPLPSIDGQVIWRELLRSLRSQARASEQ